MLFSSGNFAEVHILQHLIRWIWNLREFVYFLASMYHYFEHKAYCYSHLHFDFWILGRLLKAKGKQVTLAVNLVLNCSCMGNHSMLVPSRAFLCVLQQSHVPYKCCSVLSQNSYSIDCLRIYVFIMNRINWISIVNLLVNFI